DVYIDVNNGMNRSGIKPAGAFILFGEVQNTKGIKIIGLHGYDGHIRDTNVDDRQHKSDDAFQLLEQLQQHIENKYGIKPALVTSGSPTFPTHAKREDIECSPGTFVFWDWGYKTALPDEPFELAALVVTRVISVIDENTICTDLGHKSVAAENPLPRVHFLNAPGVTPAGQSEEHLVAKVPAGHKFTVGDVLYGVPVHICPTVALYERAFVIENNEAAAEWKVIARDRKITI
ncbi:MAG TPA: alanine racemase, partial [Chitinophagaceae bacterium]|nr:alanine racemase [Chitinophagaceae bacterium]